MNTFSKRLIKGLAVACLSVLVFCYWLQPTAADWQVINDDRIFVRTGFLKPYQERIGDIKGYEFYTQAQIKRSMVKLAAKKGINRASLQQAVENVHAKYPGLNSKPVFIETISYHGKKAYLIAYYNHHCVPSVAIVGQETGDILLFVQ